MWLISLSEVYLAGYYCLEIGFASLTLCNCFIHKLFNYTSQVKLVEQHGRKWTARWVDKKSDLVFKVGPRQTSLLAARSDLWGWICVICSWEQKLPSQFNSDLNASQDSYMNIIHQHCGVQLNTISKPIKGSIRIIVMYLLLWDITVWVLQLQSGDCKFHWLEHWGAIETKKVKKVRLCRKRDSRWIRRSRTSSMCCMRIIFQTFKRSFYLHTSSFLLLQAVFDTWCQLYLQGVATIKTPVRS